MTGSQHLNEWQWGDEIEDGCDYESIPLAGRIWLAFQTRGLSDMSARDATIELYELAERKIPIQRLSGIISGKIADPSDDELSVLAVALAPFGSLMN